MNIITLTGRTARSIELKSTQNEKVFTNFTICVDRKFKDANGNRQADFFDCIAWGKTAQFLANYVNKGDRIGVTGSLQTRKWEDQNGNKRTAYEINAEQVELLESKPKEQEQAEDAQEQPQELPFEI